MRIPELRWDRRHNVATLVVSYSRTLWDQREVGDILLRYGASGRLARVVFLDPRRMLPSGADAGDAARIAVRVLRNAGPFGPELDVLGSALLRARPCEPEARGA